MSSPSNNARSCSIQKVAPTSATNCSTRSMDSSVISVSKLKVGTRRPPRDPPRQRTKACAQDDSQKRLIGFGAGRSVETPWESSSFSTLSSVWPFWLCRGSSSHNDGWLETLSDHTSTQRKVERCSDGELILTRVLRRQGWVRALGLRPHGNAGRVCGPLIMDSLPIARSGSIDSGIAAAGIAMQVWGSVPFSSWVDSSRSLFGRASGDVSPAATCPTYLARYTRSDDLLAKQPHAAFADKKSGQILVPGRA